MEVLACFGFGGALTNEGPQSKNMKVHLYQALVMSVLLYVAETWTLLAADLRSLQAFHTRYANDRSYLYAGLTISATRLSRHTPVSRQSASKLPAVALQSSAILPERRFQPTRLSVLTSTYHLVACLIGTGNFVLVHQTTCHACVEVTRGRRLHVQGGP